MTTKEEGTPKEQRQVQKRISFENDNKRADSSTWLGMDDPSRMTHCLQEKTMKMILAVVLLGCSFSGWAQSVTVVSEPVQGKDELLAGTEVFAKDAKEVSEINVDPKAMAMLASSKDKADLIQKIKYTAIRSYEYDGPGKYRREDFDAISNRLNDGSWSCVVRERSKTEATDICMKSDAHTEMNEFVIMTAEPTEVNFIHIKGRMSFDDLAKMGGAVMPGLKKHGK